MYQHSLARDWSLYERFCVQRLAWKLECVRIQIHLLRGIWWHRCLASMFYFLGTSILYKPVTSYTVLYPSHTVYCTRLIQCIVHVSYIVLCPSSRTLHRTCSVCVCPELRPEACVSFRQDYISMVGLYMYIICLQCINVFAFDTTLDHGTYTTLSWLIYACKSAT